MPFVCLLFTRVWSLMVVVAKVRFGIRVTTRVWLIGLNGRGVNRCWFCGAVLVVG